MNLATAVDDNAVAGILLVLASQPSPTAGVPAVVIVRVLDVTRVTAKSEPCGGGIYDTTKQ
jgi:hypothetical protein